MTQQQAGSVVNSIKLTSALCTRYMRLSPYWSSARVKGIPALVFAGSFDG